MDKDWFLDVHRFAVDTPWLHWLIPPYALWGGLVALVVLWFVAWMWSRRQSDALDKFTIVGLTAVSAVVAVLLNQQVISPQVARTRPCNTLDIHALLPCDTDFSMPSDHCIIAGAFVAGLWLINRGFGIVAAALAILLAFGRVYSGMHYPSDVVVGLIAGAVIAVVIVLTLRRPVKRILLMLPDGLVKFAAGSAH